jgi:peptide/nickel transport system substrate-binding protein
LDDFGPAAASRYSAPVRRWLAAALLAAIHSGCSAGPAQPGARTPLVVGLASAPRGLDPHLYNDFVSFEVCANAFEGLTRLDRNLGVEPALAESWSSPDELTWHFRLRPGVRFHDGRAVQSADVVSSIERVRSHPRSEFTAYLVSVRGVRALGPDVVEVVTERPSPLLLNRLSFVGIVPAGSPAEIREPIGTGPYRLRAAGKDACELAAFDGYWGTRAREPALRLEVARGRLGLARLLAHELDFLEDLPPEALDSIRADPGLRLLSRPSLTTAVLVTNTHHTPFADPRLRLAVQLSLDREALARAVLRGHGRPAYQIVADGVFGFDANLPAVGRDIPEARRLLAAAGFPSGITTTIVAPAGLDLTLLQRQLADAGIRAGFEPPSAVAPGSAPLRFASFISDSGDSGDMLDGLLHSPNPALGAGGLNSFGYASQELDALIEASWRTDSLSARREALQRCMRFVMRDLPMIPLYTPNDLWGLRAELQFTPRADGRVLGVDLARTPGR